MCEIKRWASLPTMEVRSGIMVSPMEANEAPDWETFLQQLSELCAKYGRSSSPLLFRGQGNSAWHLTTTLERSEPRPMLLREFYAARNGEDRASV